MSERVDQFKAAGWPHVVEDSPRDGGGERIIARDDDLSIEARYGAGGGMNHYRIKNGYLKREHRNDAPVGVPSPEQAMAELETAPR